MPDVFTPDKRSWIMGRVKSRNTKPEMLVRSIIHRMGFRFRLHRRELPGNPDIVLPKHKKVLFVHGCFWHGHEACPRSKRPATNTEFWNTKLDQNMERDKRFQRLLKEAGWDVLVVWQCETNRPDELLRKLGRFLHER